MASTQPNNVSGTLIFAGHGMTDHVILTRFDWPAPHHNGHGSASGHMDFVAEDSRQTSQCLRRYIRNQREHPIPIRLQTDDRRDFCFRGWMKLDDHEPHVGRIRWAEPPKEVDDCDRLEEVLAFSQQGRTLEEILIERGRQVPQEEWDRLPADLIDRLDFYTSGADV